MTIRLGREKEHLEGFSQTRRMSRNEGEHARSSAVAVALTTGPEDLPREKVQQGHWTGLQPDGNRDLSRRSSFRFLVSSP
jgi:hypothetical protein